MTNKDMTPKEIAHKKLTDDIHEMFLKKNRDYGNSFENSLDEWGLLPSVIRIQEKLDRTKTSIKKELLVSDESVEDTFLDLANYAIMTVMWLNKDKPVDEYITPQEPYPVFPEIPKLSVEPDAESQKVAENRGW